MMQVFIHHIYELKKGLRRLVLHTCPVEEIEFVKMKLKRENIPCILHQINTKKVNVFFGEEVCISVLNRFHTLKLNELTDQEDFILGTLLGYDLKLQCLRFLERQEAAGELNRQHAVRAI
ncbi:MAG: DUF2023 family protein [Spirochaetales bacterium]|nr:DUF2023 family protein [Spirochaetales bacterium]